MINMWNLRLRDIPAFNKVSIFQAECMDYGN